MFTRSYLLKYAGEPLATAADNTPIVSSPTPKVQLLGSGQVTFFYPTGIARGRCQRSYTGEKDSMPMRDLRCGELNVRVHSSG